MRHLCRVVVAWMAVVCLCIAAEARAQCDNSWEPGALSLPIPGADGPIYAVFAWSLPAQPAMLIVGGDFTHIGGIAANNIAAWDGTRWQSVGQGFDEPVRALTTWNLSLIAGGKGFVSAWNGNGWTHMGTPFPTSGGFGNYPYVYALAVYDGALYVGGDFEWINSPGRVSKQPVEVQRNILDADLRRRGHGGARHAGR